jgi:hypothetical protein
LEAADVKRDMRRPARGAILGLAAVGMLLVALTVAPVALAASAVWFAWRLVSYSTGTVVEADIVDWHHERIGAQTTTSVAYARLRFIDAVGREREAMSSVGIATDPTAPGLEPLPDGPIRLRYRTWPFLALEDEPGVWFSGPIILLATAILGTMLKVLFRFSPLSWIMGT